MPRFPRSYIKTSYFHVITQGINKSFIFKYPEDIKMYIKIMYNLKKEHNLEIIAYCVMNNHTHMLVKVEEISVLSKYMQCINTKYAKYYNKKYNRVGYVFRDRYKCEGIYSEKQLHNCIKYIYNNPVKAGICNNMGDYLYSNYNKSIEIQDDEEYVFLDVDKNKDEICRNIINNFLIENNMKLENIKKDTTKLRKLIIILKNEYNISLRCIAKELNINREEIRKIYKC